MNTDRNNRHDQAGQEADHPARGTAATAKREALELARHHDPSIASAAAAEAAHHSNQYGVVAMST
ncbi:MAG: hypothetical protein EPN48_00675 [Microbacteriaceae bacterium]|nr:MAG: hypothetical protein EPN48_00675 [Microbacteriaceae bacterium]